MKQIVYILLPNFIWLDVLLAFTLVDLDNLTVHLPRKNKIQVIQ